MILEWEHRGLLQGLVVLALALLAWTRGSAPERWCAGVLLAMVTILRLYRLLALPTLPGNVISGYIAVNTVFLLTDGLALLTLIAVALRANRFYPLWIAGFQLTAVMTHLASGLMSSQLPFAYATLNIAPFYFMIITLVVGLIAHLRRVRLWGPYPSWRASSSLSPALQPKAPPLR